MNRKQIWIDQLEQLIQQKHMLSHPFYQAWTCGHLSRETLQEYAQQYYHHVKAFPTYLSALHSRCENLEIRKSILNNLMDEEVGSPNHIDLWKSFILGLGVSEELIESHQPSEQTNDLINAFKKCCASESITSGLTALYCYESQIPSICNTKIDGLKKWYGIDNPESYRYFTVHEEADVEHSKEEKKMLMQLIQPEEEAITLQNGEEILNKLDNFLSSFSI